MAMLYLCGAGNTEGVRLALKINQEQSRWNRIVLLDDDPAKHGSMILGVEIAGPFSMLVEVGADSAEVANLVTKDSLKRWSARRKIEQYGIPFAPLIHPDIDMDGVRFGRDIMVYQNALVGAGASVDDGSVIMVGAMAGHGCCIGRGCILAPAAVVNARVRLGDGVYVSPNATILPDLNIGPWATIGACSAVLKNVSAGQTVMGVPAKTVMTLILKLKAGSFPDEVRRELENYTQESSDIRQSGELHETVRTHNTANI